MSTSNGSKPQFDANGNVLGPRVGSVLEDLREQPTLREQLALGVGKAHRSVVFSHYDYRNVRRSGLGTTGRVK